MTVISQKLTFSKVKLQQKSENKTPDLASRAGEEVGKERRGKRKKELIEAMNREKKRKKHGNCPATAWFRHKRCTELISGLTQSPNQSIIVTQQMKLRPTVIAQAWN